KRGKVEMVSLASPNGPSLRCDIAKAKAASSLSSRRIGATPVFQLVCRRPASARWWRSAQQKTNQGAVHVIVRAHSERHRLCDADQHGGLRAGTARSGQSERNSA